MNKLIRSLLISAGAQESISGGYWMFDGARNQELEKFVHLIVSECAKVADEHTFAKLAGVGNDIKLHFGINE